MQLHAIGPETLQTALTLFHFCPHPFWVLVPFDLKCTWKLESCSMGVLVCKDSKFLVSKTKQCTVKGVEKGEFFLHHPDQKFED